MSAPRSYSPFPGPHYGGRPSERLFFISGAQNLSGFPRSNPAHWGLRRRGFRIPRFARIGQSSLTPSLLLSNANPLRWALRWGPPAAAYWGGKFQTVRFLWRAWLGRANASGPFPAVGAAISRPKAFSLLGRRCRAYARRMRVGAGMAKALQRAGQCPAPTKGRDASAYTVGAGVLTRPF